jgi:hypothetical protein
LLFPGASLLFYRESDKETKQAYLNNRQNGFFNH